ncbi:MAG: hypothetical protein RL708_891 [Bacteroidota bacterium]|jgi:hypothetical protein
MNYIDLIIGATLMNAMPHYVLGVWKGKMVSGFGVGNTKNIVWGFCNFLVSIGLFVYKYGFNGLVENQLYVGALFILITFFITSYFWYKYFSK